MDWKLLAEECIAKIALSTLYSLLCTVYCLLCTVYCLLYCLLAFQEQEQEEGEQEYVKRVPDGHGLSFGSSLWQKLGIDNKDRCATLYLSLFYTYF